MPLTAAEKMRLHRERKRLGEGEKSAAVTLASVQSSVDTLAREMKLLREMLSAALEGQEQRTTKSTGTHNDLEALVRSGKVTRGVPRLPACIENPSRFHEGGDDE